jgi:hypothetical protein
MNTLHSALAALAALAALSMSCAAVPQHVQLPQAPSRSAPLEARRGYYVAQRPVAVRTAHTLQHIAPLLILESGARIDHASDLIAVVDDADLLAHARRADELYSTHQRWTGGGAAVGSIGLGLLVVAPAVVVGSSGADTIDPVVLATTLIGSSVVAVAGLAMVGVGLHELHEAHAHDGSAMHAYDAALRRQLVLTDEDIGPLAPAAIADAHGDFVFTR